MYEKNRIIDRQFLALAVVKDRLWDRTENAHSCFEYQLLVEEGLDELESVDMLQLACLCQILWVWQCEAWQGFDPYPFALYVDDPVMCRFAKYIAVEKGFLEDAASLYAAVTRQLLRDFRLTPVFMTMFL